MKFLRFAGLALVLALAGQAQKLQFDFGKLAQKAKETTDVNLDGSTLQFASKFLSDKDAEQAKARKVVEGLQGIYVKSFEFDKPGAYSPAELDALRAQLRPPLWTQIVKTRAPANGENTDVFLKKESGKITGLAVISAEPTELTVAQILGPIDPEALSALAGQFGIPRLEKQKTAKPQIDTDKHR